jgi:hypothetical protein
MFKKTFISFNEYEFSKSLCMDIHENQMNVKFL